MRDPFFAASVTHNESAREMPRHGWSLSRSQCIGDRRTFERGHNFFTHVETIAYMKCRRAWALVSSMMNGELLYEMQNECAWGRSGHRVLLTLMRTSTR